MIDLMGGFAEPIDHARAFRILLDATAHPGRVLSLSAAIDAPRQLHSTAAATFLVLCDCDTPLWVAPSLHSPPVVDFLRFHTGAPITRDARSARFLLCDSAAASDALREAHSGCAEYPDRSATIVVQVATLGGGMPVSLTGPGIKDRQTFGPAGLDPRFWEAVERNHRLFPLGCDFMFTSLDQVAVLPRSTQIAIEGHA